MLSKKHLSYTESMCAICSSSNTKIVNNHAFSYLICEQCQHKSMIIKEMNTDKFASKMLSKNNLKQKFVGCLENVIEFSFCPYWTFVKNINKVQSAKINVSDFCIHSFSTQSIQIFAKNMNGSLLSLDNAFIIHI